MISSLERLMRKKWRGIEYLNAIKLKVRLRMDK